MSIILNSDTCFQSFLHSCIEKTSPAPNGHFCICPGFFKKATGPGAFEKGKNLRQFSTKKGENVNVNFFYTSPSLSFFLVLKLLHLIRFILVFLFGLEITCTSGSLSQSKRQTFFLCDSEIKGPNNMFRIFLGLGFNIIRNRMIWLRKFGLGHILCA